LLGSIDGIMEMFTSSDIKLKNY